MPEATPRRIADDWFGGRIERCRQSHPPIGSSACGLQSFALQSCGGATLPAGDTHSKFFLDSASGRRHPPSAPRRADLSANAPLVAGATHSSGEDHGEVERRCWPSSFPKARGHGRRCDVVRRRPSRSRSGRRCGGRGGSRTTHRFGRRHSGAHCGAVVARRRCGCTAFDSPTNRCPPRIGSDRRRAEVGRDPVRDGESRIELRGDAGIDHQSREGRHRVHHRASRGIRRRCRARIREGRRASRWRRCCTA